MRSISASIERLQQVEGDLWVTTAYFAAIAVAVWRAWEERSSPPTGHSTVQTGAW